MVWFPGNESIYHRLIDPSIGLSRREPEITEALIGAHRKIGLPARTRKPVDTPLNYVRRPAPKGHVIQPLPQKYKGRIGGS
jgi:hypothetical protein